MFAITSAQRCRDHVEDAGLASFLERFIVQLREEREVLRRIIETFGASPSVVKAVGGWVAEKAVRLKLARFTTFTLFETLETLRLGVQGKRGLWSYLLELADADRRLKRFDLLRLEQQADEQVATLEAFRREAGVRMAREDGTLPLA